MAHVLWGQAPEGMMHHLIWIGRLVKGTNNAWRKDIMFMMLSHDGMTHPTPVVCEIFKDIISHCLTPSRNKKGVVHFTNDYSPDCRSYCHGNLLKGEKVNNCVVNYVNFVTIFCTRPALVYYRVKQVE